MEGLERSNDCGKRTEREPDHVTQSGWKSDEAVVGEVQAAVQVACARDTTRDASVMVTRRELHDIGRPDVARMLSKVGYRKAAKMCGLRMSRR